LFSGVREEGKEEEEEYAGVCSMQMLSIYDIMFYIL
jgi:hypothetical protein